MDKPLPSFFFPQLKTEWLEMVSGWLLEELHATEEDLARDTDNSYTRGCTAFMRQRVRIMKEAASGRYSWLGVPNLGNDLVFTIEGVPCRYSNDDPDNPRKEAVTTANRYQESFLDFDDSDRPGRFCFVIDRGLEGITEPHVELLGFTVQNTVVCRWVSTHIRGLRLADEQTLSAIVAVDKPTLAPKRRERDADVAAQS